MKHLLAIIQSKDLFFLKIVVAFNLLFISNLHSQDIKIESLKSEILKRDWRYSVYLPPCYSERNSFKIIYLLHGSGGDENDWNKGISLIDSLIKKNVIEPVITVSPSSGTSWWVNGKENFETAFFLELKPFIEKKYKVEKSREAIFIAGFSMGGYGALRYALIRPDLFSAAILLSPALYNNLPPENSSAIESGSFGNPFDKDLWISKNYNTILDSTRLKNYPVKLFIAAGDDDWNHPEGIQYNIDWQANLLYSKYHKELNYPAELRIYNGGHDWKLWERALLEALPLLLDNESNFD